MLNRAEIAARLPHGPGMVLVDRVIDWDEAAIRCGATSHRDPANPLRDDDGLPVWAAIEYSAQAAALHAALLDEGNAARPGVLAALRGVRAHCAALDAIDGELVVAATLRHRDPAGAVYGFSASAAGRALIDGQFTLMFTA